jgi:excisionase family DNA binding protein
MADFCHHTGDIVSNKPTCGLPTLLTPEEVARSLRISKKTLYRWVYEKRLPYCKVGGKLLFDETRILELIRSESFHRLVSGISTAGKVPRASTSGKVL